MRFIQVLVTAIFWMIFLDGLSISVATPWTLRFVEEPADTQFAHTRSAVLNCVVAGNPKPKVSWRLARTNIEVTNITGLRYVMANNSLVFPPFLPEKLDKSIHQAEYQCFAKNKMGSLISRAAKLRAVVVERFRVYAVDHKVIVGNTAVIKAVVPSHVRQYVRVKAWHKGRDVINIGGRYSVMPSGDLVITNVRHDDAVRMYHWTAVNTLTQEIQASNPAKLVILGQTDTKSRMISDSLNLTITAGQTAVLQCSAEGFPNPHYSWKKGGKAVNIMDRFTLFAGGSLRIERVEYGDQGMYTCQASNRVGTDTLSVYLKVHVPIRFKERPKPQAVSVGKSITMECEVVGEPKPNVTWYQNVNIEPVKRQKGRISTREHDLLIATVYGQDNGVYQCVADNGIQLEQTSAEFYAAVNLPKFTDSSQTVILNPGQRLEIFCEITELSSTNTINWYHDKEIRHDGRHGYTVKDTTRKKSHRSELTKSSVSLQDDGEYKCQASNMAGSAEETINVHVRGGPNITYWLNEVTGVEGQTIFLPCRAKGYPLPKIIWTKDGQRLLDQRKVVANNGTLIIKNVQRRDQGSHECTAVNSQGKKDRVPVMVKVLVSPRIDPLNWGPVDKGLRFSRMCMVADGDGVNITWNKDGRPLHSTPGDLDISTSAFTSTISIPKVLERHSGTYSCIASNRAGVAKSSTHLVVYVGSEFLENPKDQQVLKEHTAHLTCNTKGYPPARIEWSRSVGGSFLPLNNDPRFSQLLNGTLVIRKVSKSDQGRYSCHAYNGVVGTPVSNQVTLTVHVPASIVSPPADRSAVVDGDVTFTCVAIGNLPIDMSWYNGTKRLTFNERVHIGMHTLDADHMINGTLRLSHLQLWDTRQFSCKVVNKFGKDEKFFNVTAQKKPSPPSKPAIDREGASSIVLTWKPEFNGNSPIIRFVIEYKPASRTWQDAITKVASGATRSYRLQNLKPATNYQVRLYAENSIGTSNHGKDVLVRTKEDAPSHPPQIVNITAISSTEVYIEWLPPPKEHCNGIIRGYYISYGKINRPKNNNITVDGGAIRSNVITGLAKFQTYMIVIQAFTAAGPSPRKNKVVKTQEDVPSKPPQFVEVAVLSSQSVSVRWKIPPYDSINGALKGYKVRYYKINDPNSVHEARVGKDILNITLRKLGKFTSYRVNVLAFTSKGDGVTSAVQFTTAEDIPGPPDNVRAIPVFRQKIRVLWDQPKEPNGIIREYRVYFSTVLDRPSANKTSGFFLKTEGNKTSEYVEHLKSDTMYYFWVRAKTFVGFGNASRVVRQRTKDKIIARIFDRKLPDTMAKWKTSAVLDCEAYGDPAPTIFWYSSGKDLSDASKYQELKNGSLKVMRLVQGDTGDYMCTASNRLGKETVPRKLKVQIPPSPPTRITFTSVGNLKAINITWSLGFDGYSPVTMFLLEYMADKGLWKPVYLGRNRRHFVLHNVNHTKSYFFRMSAINEVGRGRPNKILKVTFAAEGTIASVHQVDTVEEQARDGDGKKRFYNDPAILGTLITISVLIVVVLLLLIGCRVKRVTLRMPKDLKDLWDKAILGHPSQPSEETSSTSPANGQGDGVNGDGMGTNSHSPSSDGHLADSSSSVEQMASNRDSLLSLPRSGSMMHHNVTHEPIMEEPFPPPPPPYHINSPMRSLLPPPLAHDDSMSDTSSEISFGGPVYHRPTLHDAESISRVRKIPASTDPFQQQHPPIRSLNGTPGIGLGMRGPADGGSELDNTSLALRGVESNIDLRKTFSSRLGQNSKTYGLSDETVRSIYARTPASGISRVPDSAFGSRYEIGRKSVASRRGSNASQKVAPLNKPATFYMSTATDNTPASVRRDSGSSKESSCYPPEVEKAIAARDARAYDSTSSEYSSSRDELYSALEFGKRNNFEKYYGIPTLETTSMSSEATNSSEQDGICKFSASPRTVGDGFHAPVPIRQPLYNPRSRSRNNEAYLYVLDPRRRIMDGNVRMRSQLDHKGSLV